jgi:hypothetical protein
MRCDDAFGVFSLYFLDSIHLSAKSYQKSQNLLVYLKQKVHNDTL